MEIDKLNPATWERTGETMPDGAPVLLNPGNGLPCVMPRPNWPNPDIPMTAQVYRNEVKRHIEAAAPDMLAALKQAESDQMAYVDRLYRDGPRMAGSLAEARARLAATRAAIAKAEGAA